MDSLRAVRMDGCHEETAWRNQSLVMEAVWHNCSADRFVDGVQAEVHDWLDDIDRDADRRITWAELQVLLPDELLPVEMQL